VWGDVAVQDKEQKVCVCGEMEMKSLVLVVLFGILVFINPAIALFTYLCMGLLFCLFLHDAVVRHRSLFVLAVLLWLPLLIYHEVKK